MRPKKIFSWASGKNKKKNTTKSDSEVLKISAGTSAGTFSFKENMS